MPEVIADTSCLQYLFQVGALDLLRDLYHGIRVPHAVLTEIEEGRRRGVSLPIVSSLAWCELVPPIHPELLRLVTDLGPGEREVLALGLAARKPLLLLDDALARRHARLLNLPHTGTLGVLLRAKSAGFIDAVRPLLDRLHSLAFHVDPTTRENVLRLAREV